MEKIFFENSRLFFQDIFIGTIGSEVEFKSLGNYAVQDIMTDCSFAQVHFPDLVIHFTIKEYSDEFQKTIDKDPPLNENIRKKLSDFGTLTVQAENGGSFKIHDVFWTRFPSAEFQFRYNTEKMVHSLYFLHNK